MKKGFTLVEVLVALFIMAIMAGMAWRGIDGIARARTIGRERMEQILRVDTVLTQWEQDVAALYKTDVIDPIAFDGLTMRMTRSTEGGVQLVAWSVHNGDWTRWASPPVTKASDLSEYWMRSQQLLGNEPEQLHALHGVTGWQAYFCQGNNCWANAQSTGNANTPDAGASAPPPVPGGGAPAKSDTKPPTGVRIVLSFSGSPLQGTLTRDLVVNVPAK
jgi:general secretion pathway protein J